MIAAAKKWIGDTRRAERSRSIEHHVLEALWVHQYHNVVNVDLLKRVARVARFPRPRRGGARALLLARSRAGRARTARRRPRPTSIRASGSKPSGRRASSTCPKRSKSSSSRRTSRPISSSTHVATETMQALDPIVKKAIAEKRPIKFTTAAGARYFLKSVATDDLLKMDRTPAVYLELLFRPGVRDEFRREAIAALAKADEKTGTVRAGRRDQAPTTNRDATEESVVFDLVRLLTEPAREGTARREPGTRSAGDIRSQRRLTRQIGFVALDRGRRQRSTRRGSSRRNRSATLPGLRRGHADGPRSGTARRALPEGRSHCSRGLPPELAKTVGSEQGAGRPLRPHRAARHAADADARRSRSLQRRRECRPQGQGDAEQHGPRRRRGREPSTATRAAAYGDGGQTHTQEGTDNPWWEVDLGREVPIERIVVYNRTDGNLGERLEELHAAGARRADARKCSSRRRTRRRRRRPSSRSARSRRSASSARRR